MLELTPIWPDFTFGKLFIWIWANNDQIRIPRGQMSDFEQCLNWLLVNFLWPERQLWMAKLSGWQASCLWTRTMTHWTVWLWSWLQHDEVLLFWPWYFLDLFVRSQKLFLFIVKVKSKVYSQHNQPFTIVE